MCPAAMSPPLRRLLSPYRARQELDWEPSAPSLEDVFIDLMGRAKDNFQ